LGNTTNTNARNSEPSPCEGRRVKTDQAKMLKTRKQISEVFIQRVQLEEKPLEGHPGKKKREGRGEKKEAWGGGTGVSEKPREAGMRNQLKPGIRKTEETELLWSVKKFGGY